MMNASSCKYCEHFDSTSHKCEYQGKECLTIGHEDVTFTMYKEVNQDEKDRRDSLYHLQDQKRERMQEQNKLDNIRCIIHAVILFGMIIVGLVLCVLILIYRFSHPELTETQLLVYCFQKYWWMYGIVIFGFIASNAFK